MTAEKDRGSFIQSRAFKELTGVLIILFVLGVVVIVTLAPDPFRRRRSSGISCVNNLKQVSLGLRMWANENDDKFPMEVSTNQGGSKEWIGSAEVFRHFVAASNEIASPKVLACPQDSSRPRVADFASLRNQNLGYLLDLNARERFASTILVSDRHLMSNRVALANGSFLIATQQVLSWGKKPHEDGGNVGLTDGSVQQVKATGLARLRAAQQVATNWLAIP